MGQLAPEPVPEFELLANGQVAFARILRRIDDARQRILLRCFDWRDDETGRAMAHALLRAADRGVVITILKDRVAMHYEYLEATRQSFFHKRIDLVPRLSTWFLMAGYWRWGSLRQRPSALADALANHDNVSLAHDKKRFDHAKLYVFDDERMILGGMGIGNDFRLRNVDFMVEVTGVEAVARLTDRYEGRAGFDPTRRFDFLLHSSKAVHRDDDSLAGHRLKLIGGARQRLTIEMAYLGDHRCTDALVDAVKRGVFVTLLTSARANICADLNLYICDQLLRRTRNADNLRIVLHPRMVHGKAVVVDGERVDIGSTNFTPLSHGGYEEVDFYCRDRGFTRGVEEAIERDIQDGSRARPRVPYRRIYAVVERAIVARQLRKTRNRKTAPRNQNPPPQDAHPPG
jgi:cardiolipin synthase A/B